MKWRILWQLAILVAMAVLAQPVISLWKEQAAEATLREGTRKALMGRAPELAGEDWRVVIDGTVAIVHGRLSSPEAFGSAKRAIEEIHRTANTEVSGLTAVYSALAMDEAPPWLSIRQPESDQIVVDGLLSADVVYDLMSTIRSSFPANTIRITNRIQFGDDVFSPEWGEAVAEVAPAFLRSVRSAELRIEEDCATLRGTARSEDAKRAISDDVTRKLSWAVNHVFNQVGAAPASQDPVASRLVIRSDTGNDEVVIEGSVGDQKTRKILLAQLEEAMRGAIPIRDEIEVDPRANDIWWAYTIGDLFSEFAGNPWLKEIRIEENGVTLNGRVATVDERLRLEAAVTRQFPQPAFHVTTELEVEPTLFAQLPVRDEGAGEVPVDVPVEDAVMLGELARAVNATVIYFPRSSGYLSERERKKLTPLADAMKATKQAKLVISGNTDSHGSPAYNKVLALQRADAVLKALVALGVDETRTVVRRNEEPPAESGGEHLPRKRISAAERRRVDFALLDLGDESGESVVANLEELAAATPTPPAPLETEPQFLDPSDDLALAELAVTASGTSIYFKRGGAMLDPSFERDLHNLANVLKRSPNGGLRISAFVANGDDEDARRRLCGWRCNVAARYLVDAGVDPERLDVVSEPRTGPDPEVPSWRDHRVEFEARKWIPASAVSAIAARTETSALPKVAEEPPLAPGSRNAPAEVIYFASDSARIRSSERAKLAKIARACAGAEGADRTLNIRGYTDRWGDPEYNCLLADRRSGAVHKTLVQLGAPPERLAIIPASAADPNEEKGAPGDSWKKRRVELALR